MLTKEQMGNLIVIEGNDGMGKSSICDKLFSMTTGPKTIYQEPGSTDVGKMVRGYLKSGGSGNRLTDSILFTAARSAIAQNIRDDLANGKTVFMDRYWPSTLAYQLYDINDDDFIKDFILNEKVVNLFGHVVILQAKDEDQEVFLKRSMRGDTDTYDNITLEAYKERSANYNRINYDKLAPNVKVYKLTIEPSDTISFIVSQIMEMVVLDD